MQIKSRRFVWITITALGITFVVEEKIADVLKRFAPWHVESATVQYPLTLDLSVMSASGGESRAWDRYVLTVGGKEVDGQLIVSLTGVPVPYNSVDHSGPRMYGQTSDFEALATSLAQILPSPQLRSVLETVTRGQETQIGGRVSGMLFDAETLRGLGMSFRPLDT